MEQAPGGGIAWRALLPPEHGLWGWVVVPVSFALLAAPGLATTLAALASLAGFGAFNAAGRAARGNGRARRVIAPALAVGAVAGAASLWFAERPAVLVACFAAGAVASLGGHLAWRGRLPRGQALELAVILGLSALGAAIAIGAGAPIAPTVADGLAISAWLALGLWWINRTLAPLLRDRAPWPAGGVVVGAWTALAVGASLVLGAWVTALAPLLYAARATVHAPPASARDAKRLGLTELGWGLGIAALLALTR